MYIVFTEGGRIYPLLRHLHLQSLELTCHLVKLLLSDRDALSHLVSTLCEPMVVLGLEDPTDLRVDPVDLDTLALHRRHDLCHL